MHGLQAMNDFGEWARTARMHGRDAIGGGRQMLADAREALARRRRAAGLVCAGLACGALLSAAVMTELLLPVPAAPEVPPPQAVAALPPAVAAVDPTRLPRPRPDEPLTTGSIRPAQAETEVAAARLHDRAVLTANAWEDCDRVASSEVLRGRSGSRVVHVACANGTSAYLDESEIDGATPPPAAQVAPAPAAASAGQEAPVRAARLSDTEALGACEAKLRNGLAVPASFSRVLPTTDIRRADGGALVVSFDYSALNGFGFPLAMQAECAFGSAGLARLQVTQRQ